MNLVALEFQEIRNEVEIYFAYLEKIDHDRARLERNDGNAAVHEAFGREFKTILKANAIILLYHLVEATVQRSVDNIIETIAQEKLHYSEASAKVKKIWSRLRIRQLRRATEETWVDTLNELVDTCLQKEVLRLSGREIVKSHAGNIDAQTIRNLADDFGFEMKARPESRGGGDLEKIRNSRNLLAHGVQRFTQVGGEMTVTELAAMKDRVIFYLEDLIACSDQFVQGKNFRFS